MTFPSPGPVDALMTWAQFKDLFERGIIQDPILYSGLTTLGTKFTVRRRVIVTRGARSIATNKLTLQSVVIIDSLGPVGGTAVLGFGFSTPFFGAASTARIRNPANSGKVMFLKRATISHEGTGAVDGLIVAPTSPANADLATSQASRLYSLNSGSKTASIAKFSSANGNQTGAAVNIGLAGDNPSEFPLAISLQPDSSIDVYVGTTVDQWNIEWVEQ